MTLLVPQLSHLDRRSPCPIAFIVLISLFAEIWKIIMSAVELSSWGTSEVLWMLSSCGLVAGVAWMLRRTLIPSAVHKHFQRTRRNVAVLNKCHSLGEYYPAPWFVVRSREGGTGSERTIEMKRRPDHVEGRGMLCLFS